MEKIIAAIFAQKQIALPQQQIQKLALYGQMVIETNAHMNLTAITAPEEIAEKHFLDAYQLVPVFAQLPGAYHTLLDIGSGAGFPGIPLAIFLPQVSVTLLESMEKRCDFLRRVVQNLALPNVQVVCNRAEQWGRSEKRACYQMVTARAVAKLGVLCEYALPLLAEGGYFFAYKGAKAEEEIGEAQNALDLLGGAVVKKYPYTLLEPGERCIVAVEKKGPTPEKYPRRAGVPERKPL